MSGPYAHPQTGPPPPSLGAPRLIAAALLVVAAALAVGGTFLALSVRRYDFGLPGDTVVSTTGWAVTIEGAPGMTNPPGAAPLGIPVVVAAGLAAVAAILLLLSVRRSGDHVLARIAGIGAVGLLVGSVWIIWIELFTLASNAAVAVRDGSDGGFHPVVVFGAGAWLLLAAALLALACIPLLAMPPADAVSAQGRVPYGVDQEPTSPWSRSPAPAAAPPVTPPAGVPSASLETPPAGAPPIPPDTPPGDVAPVPPGTPPTGAPPVPGDSPAHEPRQP
ncbi:hypothetical protein GCM10010464_23530 [Pseudonocardia yunnanensis]|uniref:DUF2567 domain-containing protein n=1 Tax=Pseudonocardia yunnanensis TaxID=58107 RepID=A0ABW4F7X4_9PSEU